ncbi:hypothetical protein IQ266_11760 [filamentous cyanobacterium LEGE 11480]|uniref:Uncharacterized protein n=1 Tax=Romeriopsis navalis LEGE 11480 TaxID=2777977 RepID=A0A928Z4J6_9CYAN|nr:hypothetical protein [Romeriopsis navalis]MBE9030408.1 hypothetical protein [Romeriopsis navalis LEGE 11480]
MFLTELSPLLRDCLAQPIAFTGGLLTGALRLDVNDDPVKTWLSKQGAVVTETAPANNGAGPQSIEID